MSAVAELVMEGVKDALTAAVQAEFTPTNRAYRAHDAPMEPPAEMSPLIVVAEQSLRIVNAEADYELEITCYPQVWADEVVAEGTPNMLSSLYTLVAVINDTLVRARTFGGVMCSVVSRGATTINTGERYAWAEVPLTVQFARFAGR